MGKIVIYPLEIPLTNSILLKLIILLCYYTIILLYYYYTIILLYYYYTIILL